MKKLLITMTLLLSACNYEDEMSSRIEYEHKTEIVAEIGECVGSGYSGFSGANYGKAAVKFESGKFATLACPLIVGMEIKFKRWVRYSKDGVLLRTQEDWVRER